jgi:hypothetical protein
MHKPGSYKCSCQPTFSRLRLLLSLLVLHSQIKYQFQHVNKEQNKVNFNQRDKHTNHKIHFLLVPVNSFQSETKLKMNPTAVFRPELFRLKLNQTIPATIARIINTNTTNKIHNQVFLVLVWCTFASSRATVAALTSWPALSTCCSIFSICFPCTSTRTDMSKKSC